GWAAVLARLSGQDDVVIGTPSANRGYAEVEELIGFFVNTLPLRVDLSDGPRVGELLARVKERALEAQRNQDIPFEQVVERVHPVRSLAYTPLFQVMFAWQNAPDGTLELPGLTAGHAGAAESDTAKFDLSLTLWENGGRIEGAVEYATALFERATVERHLVYLRRVLDAFVADDLQTMDALPLLPDAERRLVVEEWNASDAVYPPELCIHEIFEAQVACVPDAVALVHADEVLTYAGLNRRANQLAHHLAGRGVGPDARVAICASRTPELVVGLLAILKAGGAYVPLDPGHPEERLRYLLDDSAPVLVLTQGALRERFAAAPVPVVALDEDAPAWAREPEHDPARAELTPGHLAYVIYTSGSTGAPKGVMVAHRSVARQVAAIQAGFGLRADDRSLQFASVTFDASVEEIFGALLSGAALVLRGEKWIEGARTFWDACARHRVTVVDLPTRFWQLLLDEPSAEVPECVRLLAIGGEAVEPAALEAWFRCGGHRPPLLNTYGPTETTVNATLREIVGDPASWRSIGRPVANTRACVLDARGQPVPVGVAGELHIGGGQVARGYLGRPGLTAERFVPDPFATEPGARMYRTGDRVRWLADGTIDFLGRTDFQVKIRGFRIEPGEIEARLREHAAVRQAVVLAREDAPGEKRLVAYVVGDAEAGALKAHLDASLPPYMVPAAYVRLEALPLTSSGKLDRKALPAPDGAAFVRRHEPPRTLTERVLAEIWSELLGVERVSRRDHFFDLGGHSLLAVRLVSRVREAINPAATVEEVFAHPTLHDLAARLAGGGEWFGTDHAIPVRETGSERPLFVAHDAAGVVFYAQILRPYLDAEIPVYALPGPLKDADELSSLDDLVTRLVRMITEVQPEGPYRLAGWSAGGVFAYAVAERLIATGQVVEFVGMLDTSRPAGASADPFLQKRLFTVLDLLARDNGVTPATPDTIRKLKEETEGLDLPAFIAECKARGLLPETVTVARAQQVDSR
ncbi:MAG TPA: amino acid adenylation domain-containing protein, partial [Longimicrobium sp.]|nr:amino acid adenylation domain-containing protein [Longimicrobium sp.]